ncbi:hypothetical protein [Streptomyces sp. C1-2]|uniref:hypothetical protein n=1 Tax=Streptomyces sp. C1-2 TaxID=2720022 RepID=UPI001432654D|nr:hypothetical protein [Streptomyces sp. C1-2]NJP73730.1 hypothetical protein [Streptomyces sp. C1-2]
MALRCKQSFSAYVGGRPRVVRAGSLVEDDDPIVKGREASFESVDAHLAARRSRVEQTTAAPGEKRSISLPTLFDPGEHKAPEVLEYLKSADEEERRRVLAAEAAGQKRKGILGAAE